MSSAPGAWDEIAHKHEEGGQDARAAFRAEKKNGALAERREHDKGDPRLIRNAETLHFSRENKGTVKQTCLPRVQGARLKFQHSQREN